MLPTWLPALLSSAAAPLQVCFSSTLQEVELYRHVGIGTATYGETGLAQAPRLINQWHRWGMSAGSTRHLKQLLSVRSCPGWCLWRALVPVPACVQQLKWSVTACNCTSLTITLLH